MKPKWILNASLTVVIAGLLATTGSTQTTNAVAPPPHRTTVDAAFMRQKLVYSQKIMEGIVLENYDLVISNAWHLAAMSKKDAFLVVSQQEYVKKTKNFQNDIENMVDAARATNNVEVLNAYHKITLDCIDCHKTFRPKQAVLGAKTQK